MECPFRDNHEDGSGRMSFFVSPDINAYHCFAGETRVPTSEGTFLIKDLCGKSARVLSFNGEFVSAKFKSFGKQQLWELRLTRDGVEKILRTTSGHRWYIYGIKGTTITENLKVGQYLQTVDFSHCMEYNQSLRGIRHGIIFGDGTLDTGRRKVKSLVHLHGVKMEIRGLRCRKTGEPFIRVYHVKRGTKFKELPPLNAKLSYIRGFLAGYVATDGCFTKQGLLLLASSKYEDMDFCKQAFYRLGISTGTIHYQMRKGYGSTDTPLYFLMVKTTNLDSSFFIREDQRNRFLSYHKKYERNRWRIVSVQKTDTVEEVYCAEVPKYHSFALEDNILTGNCFSCHSHGNLVRLLTTKFGVNYFEAMSMVRLTEYKPEKKEFDLDVMWDMNRPPKEFLDRGYTKECLKHFRVGMTDKDSILIPYYRNFNSPIELIGYQERWYSPDRRVKNSKGFEKKSYLYNLDHSFDYVILVEGQSDVWRVWQHGYNVCALMGSDMSNEQVKMLSKFKTVYLALDNDEAGRRGTEIAYYLLKNHCTVLLIPYETKDPGECKSKESWDDAFRGSTDYVVYSMEMSMGWDGYLDMRDEVIAELKRRVL